MHRIILVLLMLLPLPAAAEVKVVATIAPLAGIAAAVMEGVAVPDLLITNNASPHTYQLRPSDAAALAKADIVLWDGPGMENFLANRLTTLAPQAALLQLTGEQTGASLLEVRMGGVWEFDDDGDQAAGTDPHAWLDSGNALKFAARLTEVLVEKDPEHAGQYKSNLERFSTSLKRLDAEIGQLLAPVRERKFIVFHDAYQYFERKYGLQAAGSITLEPDVPPSARRIAELQQRIRSGQVACVFSEPQFNAQIVNTLMAGSQAKTGVLNADASDIAINGNMYQAYLRRLAAAFHDCLAP